MIWLMSGLLAGSGTAARFVAATGHVRWRGDRRVDSISHVRLSDSHTARPPAMTRRPESGRVTIGTDSETRVEQGVEQRRVSQA
jgi:hypothetical protein